MSDALLARVIEAAPSLPFVTLVHWLERLLGAEVDPAGRGLIALRHDPALAFHACELAAEARPGAAGVTVTTTFAGLTGAVSPLPTPLLEALACDDERALPEHALLDVFQHRLLALLYQGLRASDPAREGGATRAGSWVLALAGLSEEGLAAATSVPRHTVLRLAPLLILHPPNAARLCAALRDQLDDLLGDAEVCVAELQGGAETLTEAARTRLGVDLRLGRQSALGARCPAPGAAIALTLAPLAPEAFLALRPGGERAAQLAGLVRLLVPESIAVRVTLRSAPLAAAALGRASLGAAWLRSGNAPSAARFTVA